MPMPNFNAPRQCSTLLLIDDDVVVREVLATMLGLNGYTVHTAADGARSLEILEAGQCAPDAILMDAQLPGLSGAQLIGELRARTRAGIYVISGSTPPGEVIAAADGFLLKPFSLEALQGLLETHPPRPAPASASAVEPDEPPVSPQTLAQLRALMPESAIREIFSALVADLARRLSGLEAAIARDDRAEARRIGHAIKGGCAMAGALQAARLGALIESGALESEFDRGDRREGNHLDNNAPVLRDLRAALRALERMLVGEIPA
jgi:CheY-like chemotaxis protein